MTIIVTTVWIYTIMTITTEEHRQSFIDCIEAAILDNDVKLARALLNECEGYISRTGNKLLTNREIVDYYEWLKSIEVFDIIKLCNA